MRKFLMLMLMGIAMLHTYAQTKTISGTITDSNGQPVEAASIQIKGTKTGTTSDKTGGFKISAKSGDVLVISAINFAATEITVSNQSQLSITLTGTSATVEEVVVTAVGIKRADKALGYAVAKVDPNTIIQKSEPDVLKSLQGKVPGVDIRSSQGTPGAATRIQIRGNSSFFGNNQPLIVVDGVPYSNDQVSTSSQTSGGTGYSSGIANLDPNDIASMNILKGASASALYGSRALNGVVLITTKSGSAARSKKGLEVTVKSAVSLEKIANLPAYQNLYGAGSQGNYSNSNGSWGPAFSTLDSIPAWPEYQAAYPELFPNGKTAYRAYPNNVKDLFKTGVVYENSVGFNGGDDKTSVSLTASQLSHNGYVENSSYRRYNIGMGGSTKLNFGLNIRGNFSYANSQQMGGYFGENQVDGAASLFARSLFLARNWDLNLPSEDRLGNPLIPNGGGQFDNPHWSAYHNVATTNEERFIAGFHADFNINKWVKVDYNFGSNVNSLRRKEITDIGSRAAEGLGRIVLDNYRNQELQSDLLVTFTPNIGKDFTLRAVVGHSYNQRTTTRQASTGNKFITPGIYTLGNTSQQHYGILSGTDYIYGDVYYRRRIIGVFGDVTLGYKNFAFLNLTGRNDWSSTLPVNNRSYFYPAANASFVFTDAFGIKSNIIDFGKVRVGWAKVGSDTDPYQLEELFALGTNFLGQPTGSRSSTAFNPNLKPEFAKELEIGTQLSFLKRRIDIDFTWYNKTSSDLIAQIQTPVTTGFSQLNTNFGEINNKGIEIGLTLRPIQSKSFTWEIRGAFTKNKNIVKKLIEGTERIQLAGVLTGISPYLEPGMPFGYLRGSKVARDDNGNILINPASGAMINSSQEGMIGNPNPDYKLGITNTFSYKGFFLSTLFDMTKGGDIYSVTVSSLLGRGVTLDTKDRTGSFVIPGVYGDPNTEKPILDGGGKEVVNHTAITMNDLYFSPNGGSTFAINSQTEWNVYDATVYRLRELSLGYEFPKSLFKKMPIGSLTLSVTGRNLWYLAPNVPKYTHFDPEVNSFGSSTTQGIELSAAPTTRRYGINLSVTF